METVIDKISKYEGVWKSKVSETSESRFWKAVALSYIEQDIEMEEQQVFITQISFYPKLIETLISVLEHVEGVEINITFFSTLLPRHYWNFPVKFVSKNGGKHVTYSRAMRFLDNYRDEICKCVKTSKPNMKIDIRRILFLSDEEAPVNKFGNTDIYTKSDFEKDFNYYCLNENGITQNKIKWNAIVLMKDARGRSIVKTNDILLDGNPEDLDLQDDIVASDRKEESIYYLPYYNKNRKGKSHNMSVGDFYINNLHTKPNENAKYIIIGNKKYKIKDNKKGFYEEGLVPILSPNLSYIEISYKSEDGDKSTLKYILDTYMDIEQEIVRLKIIKANDNLPLLVSIKNVIDKSVPIKSNRKKMNVSKSLYIERIETEIKSYINGENVTSTTKEKVEQILNKMNSISNKQIREIYESLQKKPVSNSLINTLYQELC